MNHPSSSDSVHFLIDQRVPTRHGFSLSVDVVLPRSGGPFPSVFLRTPYESAAQRSLERGVWWARRGYAFVSGDCRGRYESEGEFYPYHPDGEDGHDTIEWIAEQPWSDGKVGMAGSSYGGLVQWQSAPLGPRHLSAMAAHVICDDYFSNYHYVGGAFQLGLSLMAGVTFNTNMPVPGFGDVFDNGRVWSHLPLIDLDLETIGKEIPWYRDWLAHGKYDDYWAEIDTSHQFGNIDVPVFMRCGWFDVFGCNIQAVERDDQWRKDRTGPTQRTRSDGAVDSFGTRGHAVGRPGLRPRVPESYRRGTAPVVRPLAQGNRQRRDG